MIPCGGRHSRNPRRKTPWLCLSILLLALPGYGDQATELLSAGGRSLADARYAEAARSFQRITSDFPQSVAAEQAGYLLAVSLFYGERWEESLAALADFRSRHPRSLLLGRSSYWLGAANLRLGRYEKALAFLTESDPQGAGPASFDASTLLLTGMAMEGLRRDPEAAVLYRRVLSDPSAASLAAEARFRLAGTELRAGRFGPARDLYDRILLDSAGSPWVRDSLFFLAESELSLGYIAEADRHYRTLLAVYPDSPWREAATFRLADAAWRLGRPGPTLALADLYLQQYPSGAHRGSAYRLRAEVAREGKDFGQAVRDYDRAVQLLGQGDERQGALYSVALAQLASGRREDAARSFGLAAQGTRGPVSEKAAYQRAVLLADTGSVREAIDALETGARDYPDGARAEDSLRLLASLLEKAGNHEAAVARWDALIARFPRSSGLPEALFRRAGSLTGLGRAAPALDDYQRIIADFPSSPWKNESQYAIGYSYAQRGEYPRALPYFQAVAQDTGAGTLGEKARLSVGISLFNMGSFSSAVEILEKLLGSPAAGPLVVSRGTLVLYLGRSFYRMERLEEAARRFAEAVQLFGGGSSPEEAADAAWWLGWATLRLGRIEEARDAFLTVARQHPSDSRASESLYRAGVCETLRHDDLAAVRLFDAVLRVSAGVGGSAEGSGGGSAVDAVREQVLYEKGWALYRLRRPAESAAAFDELARDFPKGRMAPAAYFKLAEASLDRQEYTEAGAGFRRVAKDFPQSALALQALYWSAEASRRGGDARGSLEGYWASLSAGADSGLLETTLDGFRAAMRALDDLDLARQFAERAHASPGLSADSVAGVQLAYAELLLSSRPDDALALIGEVRKSAPPEPRAGEANLLIGKYYATIGELSRALTVFTALGSARTDEVGARAVRERGLVLEAMGRTAEAIDELATIAGRFPGYDDLAAEGLSQARRIALARGDQDRASRIEQTLRAAYPGSPWARELPQPP